jgi:hypothetical protein
LETIATLGADDRDGLGVAVGRIFLANASPVGAPWVDLAVFPAEHEIR